MMTQSLKVAFWLIMSDLREYQRNFLNKVINFYVWFVCNLIVCAYLLPHLGITSTYGILALTGSLATIGCFEGYTSLSNMAQDFEITKVVNYYATLPLHTWMMFVCRMISLAVLYTCLTVPLLPIGKLLLWYDFNLLGIHWPLFVLILVVGNLFYGALTLFMNSIIKGVSQVDNAWVRVILPLWFFGGFGFSWAAMYQASKLAAWCNLFNPVMCIAEGFRVAVLGPEGFLNIWLCVAITGIMAIGMGFVAVIRLKRRLDLV